MVQGMNAHRSANHLDLLRGHSPASELARVRPITDRTHPARLIVDSARALDADLIVVGKRKRPALESLLVGSVTRHVLADTEADVLVVPLPG